MAIGPMSRAGRQTLVYLALVGCGPVLTACVMWAMNIIRHWEEVSPIARLDAYAKLAGWMALSLFVIVIALTLFVSIRAIKIGKGGLEAEANDNGDDPAPAGSTLTATATIVATPTPPAKAEE